jgi:uncharacterized membrane protein YkoI
MKRSFRHIYLGISATLLALPAVNAMAATQAVNDTELPKYEAISPKFAQISQFRGDNVDRFAQRKQDRRISASQAKSIAQRRVPGAKFVNVQMSGRDTYRVRLQQKNGRIVDVYVDARTGRVKN